MLKLQGNQVDDLIETLSRVIHALHWTNAKKLKVESVDLHLESDAMPTITLSEIPDPSKLKGDFSSVLYDDGVVVVRWAAVGPSGPFVSFAWEKEYECKEASQ